MDSLSVLLKINQAPDYPIGDYLFYWEETENFSLNEVLNKFKEKGFEALGHHSLFNKGYTESIWWFGFQLENELDAGNMVILSPAGAAIKEAILFTFDENDSLINEQVSGFLYSGNKRAMNSRLNSYELLIPPNSIYTYLLRVDSRGLNTYIPFFLDEPRSYWEYEISRTAFFGSVAGVLMLAFFFGLSLWIFFREKVYLTFSGYLICCLALILEEDGFLFLWVYGDFFGSLSSIVIPFFSLMMSVLLLNFINQFFGENKSKVWNVSKLYMLINYFFAILIMGSLFIALGSKVNKMISWTALFISICNMVIVLAMTVLQFRSKGKIAYYLALANAILIFGFSNYVLNIQGVTDWHPLYPNGLVVGSLVNVFLLTIGIIHRYYIIRNEKEELSLEVLQQERKLSKSIIQAQEKERQRIAKDLHDDLGGLLAITKLQVEFMMLGPKKYNPRLDETHKLLEIACKDIRYIAHELMPREVEDKSLKEMVSEILDMVGSQDIIKITYEIADLPKLQLEIKINLFRIIKELLNNIIKHAEATEAQVNIFLNNHRQKLNLVVSDNGKGIPRDIIDNPENGLGLVNLANRVNYLKGKISFESNERGTKVSIEVPVGTGLT
ncbi:7TM diverse intracellular signaling domain-containing protein [Aquiflexum sp.]|uniref:sensor histidine kinase n=1 Tax=Aquiflexum sp. TaxID=1872584 RepID=UPI00359336DB